MSEVSWDAGGTWIGDGIEQPMRQLDREHQALCGYYSRVACGRFVCSTCGRCVPWCFGGDGTKCDDCAE